MICKEIHSQEEYEANKDFGGILVIKCQGIILRGNASAELCENASTELWGNAHAVLCENASAILRDNARAELWGNASAELCENASAILRDNARAELGGNAHAVLRENAWAELKENTHAELCENASAILRDNARAELWGNAHAVLCENASVELRENAHAELRENTRAVLRENAHAVLRGNASAVALDNAFALLYDQASAKKLMNATVKKYKERVYDAKIFGAITEHQKGKIVLYKSVNPETLCDFHTGKIKYAIGTDVECPDWDPDPNRDCGGGLHLSHTAAKTQDFNRGKILKCLVDPKDVVIYSGSIEKVRCRKVHPIAVVDIHGREIMGGGK